MKYRVNVTRIAGYKNRKPIYETLVIGDFTSRKTAEWVAEGTSGNAWVTEESEEQK